MTSAEFRKTYPRLTEAAEVQANGHAIGLWIPFNSDGFAPVEIRDGAIFAAPIPQTSMVDDWHLRDSKQAKAANQQAERDAILRKINRGKG